MGLDMCLEGRKFLWTNWNQPERNIKEDGFRLKEKRLELGYWRKHPDLHGFIVETFADGRDDCQEIWLDWEHIKQIIEAIKDKKLPKTSGFFFGESDGTEDEESIKIFESAIKWLETKEENVMKDVYYQASW